MDKSCGTLRALTALMALGTGASAQDEGAAPAPGLLDLLSHPYVLQGGDPRANPFAVGRGDPMASALLWRGHQSRTQTPATTGPRRAPKGPTETFPRSGGAGAARFAKAPPAFGGGALAGRFGRYDAFRGGQRTQRAVLVESPSAKRR